MKIKFLLFWFGCLIMWGCSNDHEEDLVAVDPILDMVTYENVQPIFQNNCLSCHSNPPTNGASLPLTSYELVKSAVQNELLIERINSQDPDFAMPFGGPKLPQNLIDLIEQWNTDGLLEN